MNDVNLLELASTYGFAGLMAAALFIQNIFMQKRIITIVENNTKAMQELKDHCANRNAIKS
jgi:hypothetical protein